MRRLGLRKAGGWPQITKPRSDGAIRTQASGSGAWIPCCGPAGSGRTPDRGSHTGLLIGNDALFSQIRHGVRGFPARTPFSTRLPLASPSHRSPRFKTVTAHGVRTAQLSPEDKAPVSLHGHQTHSRHPQNTYSALNVRRLSLKCSRSSLELVIGKGTPRPHTRWLGQAPEPTRIFDTQSRKTHCPASLPRLLLVRHTVRVPLRAHVSFHTQAPQTHALESWPGWSSQALDDLSNAAEQTVPSGPAWTL